MVINAVTLTYPCFLLYRQTACYGPPQRLKPKYLTPMAGTFLVKDLLTDSLISIVSCICFVLLCGLGNGMMYNATVSTATKWFDKRNGKWNCIGCLDYLPYFSRLGNSPDRSWEFFRHLEYSD